MWRAHKVRLNSDGAALLFCCSVGTYVFLMHFTPKAKKKVSNWETSVEAQHTKTEIHFDLMATIHPNSLLTIFYRFQFTPGAAKNCCCVVAMKKNKKACLSKCKGAIKIIDQTESRLSVLYHLDEFQSKNNWAVNCWCDSPPSAHTHTQIANLAHLKSSRNSNCLWPWEWPFDFIVGISQLMGDVNMSQSMIVIQSNAAKRNIESGHVKNVNIWTFPDFFLDILSGRVHTKTVL